MLLQAKFPRALWKQALQLVVRIINATPSSALGGMTPYEAFYGVKPDLSMLRVFGCRAYVHIQKKHRKQEKYHTQKCVYMGFKEGYKGFKCYNTDTNQFVISRDVTFDEDEFPGIPWEEEDAAFVPISGSGTYTTPVMAPSTTTGPSASLPPAHRPPPADDSSSSDDNAPPPRQAPPPPRRREDSEDYQPGGDEDDTPPPPKTPGKGKGKGKARAQIKSESPPPESPISSVAFPSESPVKAKKATFTRLGKNQSSRKVGRELRGLQRDTWSAELGYDNDEDPMRLRSRTPAVPAQPPLPSPPPVAADFPPLGHHPRRNRGAPRADYIVGRPRLPLRFDQPSGGEDSEDDPPSSEGGGGETSNLAIQAMEIVYGANQNQNLTYSQAVQRVFTEQANKVAITSKEPKTFKEAMERSDKDKWLASMQLEMKAHLDNGTWELVQLPPGRKAIGSRWVFKVKKDAEGKVERYKSRLTAQGFSQRPGIDFHEVFAPTMRWGSIRAILALAALEDAEIESVDVSNAYLNGVLLSDEAVYMRQPEDSK